MHRLPSERNHEGLPTLAARIPKKDDREDSGAVPCILQHHVSVGIESHERFAYRVTKDYGNVFYKDYLKMVLGDDFTEVMGYADAPAEKCGDVVEMWLGMLDLANLTKSQITFMETKADPGELLAGLEA